ncbi:MAG: hypothetical protein J7K36_10480 [Archaeoglobaceae archaeon]|nr:hypothetical protein [Archaeoglobaceae archaeon]
MNSTKLTFELLKTLGLKGSYEILALLKEEPKRWSDLEKKIKDKQALSYRFKELFQTLKKLRSSETIRII